MDVACYNSSGEAIYDAEGELVCRQSFPSRPLYFLNDPKGENIQKAYFSNYPHVWHHGDFIVIGKNSGGVQVLGRSDTTLNPGGIRIGTADIYRQIEKLPFIMDGVCVGRNNGCDIDIVLFVKIDPKKELSQEHIDTIKKSIRRGASPHHVPQYIYPVSDIPYTRSGKKMELLVSRIVNARQSDN